MERISIEKRAAVLRCLIEGCSLAAVTRITGAAKNTIQRVLAETAEACEAYHDEHAVDLPTEQVQLDEQWSYVGCKEDVKRTAKQKHEGDVWCWTALDADSKFLVSWVVGNRTIDEARAICRDLASRFRGSPQVTSDGWTPYANAVPRILSGCDFGQLIKKYRRTQLSSALF